MNNIFEDLVFNRAKWHHVIHVADVTSLSGIRLLLLLFFSWVKIKFDLVVQKPSHSWISKPKCNIVLLPSIDIQIESLISNKAQQHVLNDPLPTIGMSREKTDSKLAVMMKQGIITITIVFTVAET